MSRKITIELISFIFLVLFVYTAVTKLLDHELFLSQLGKSFLLYPIAEQVAWAVPLVELLTAALLLTRWRIYGFYSSFALMVIFTVYVAVVLVFAPELPCSCGGVIAQLGWTEHLIFNISLVTLSATAIAFAREKRADSSVKPAVL